MSTALALSPTSLPASVMAAAAKHSADDDFTFDDLISIVNPLQHIPVVSTIYRSLTGETIKPFERIVGDTLYGGVWGGVSAVANVVYQEATGKDFGQTVLDFLKDEVLGDGDDAQTATAPNAAQGSPSTTDTTAAVRSGRSSMPMRSSARLGARHRRTWMWTPAFSSPPALLKNWPRES